MGCLKGMGRKVTIPSLIALMLGLGLMAAPSTLTTAEALPKGGSSCYAVVTIAIVCSLGTCDATGYIDDYWCSRTWTSDFEPPEFNPSDNIDENRMVDDHRDVLKTSDPCGWQFDNNDRLGTNHGGPNTTRPGHTGVDIQANEGDPVGVVAHGTIRAVGWQNPSDPGAGCGYRVIVDHFNGDVSYYCHLVADSERFLAGDTVRAGTVIADADSTGNSTGHHLHLSYFEGGSNRIEYWDKTGSRPSASELNGNC